MTDEEQAELIKQWGKPHESNSLEAWQTPMPEVDKCWPSDKYMDNERFNN